MRRMSVTVPLALAVTGLAAAACGGGSGTGAASTTSSVPAAPAANRVGGGDQPLPGAAGTVAAVNGSTIEVQDPTAGQTTVDITGTTSIVKTVADTSSDLAVGDCVSATGTRSSSGVVAATNVTIQTLSGASCTRGAGFGGGGGFLRDGAGRTAAGGTRTTLTPAQRARLASFGAAFGKIDSIAGNTVQLTVPTPATTTPSTSPPGRGPRLAPSHTFTFGSGTTFDKTEAGSVSDITVGACVTAFGPAADNGAVTAQRITIRPPVNGTCSRGLGGRFGFGRAAGGAAGGAGAGG